MSLLHSFWKNRFVYIIFEHLGTLMHTERVFLVILRVYKNLIDGLLKIML